MMVTNDTGVQQNRFKKIIGSVPFVPPPPPPQYFMHPTVAEQVPLHSESLRQPSGKKGFGTWMVCFITEKSETAARFIMSSMILCFEMSLKGSSTVTSLSVTHVKIPCVGADRNRGFKSSGGAETYYEVFQRPKKFCVLLTHTWWKNSGLR